MEKKQLENWISGAHITPVTCLFIITIACRNRLRWILHREHVAKPLRVHVI